MLARVYGGIFRGLLVGSLVGCVLRLFGGWVGGLPGWLGWWGCGGLCAWWGQLGGVFVWCGRPGSHWLGPALGFGFRGSGAAVRVARWIVVWFLFGSAQAAG